MVLHKLSSNMHFQQALKQCLKICTGSDAILFTEDSVYALIDPIAFNSMLAITSRIYLLAPDANARGLTKLPKSVQQIDYTQMVELTLEYDKTLSW